MSIVEGKGIISNLKIFIMTLIFISSPCSHSCDPGSVSDRLVLVVPWSRQMLLMCDGKM